MRIGIEEFRGHIPRLNPRKLPVQHAQLSQDARMLSGALEAWKDTEFTANLSKTAASEWALRTTLPSNGLDYDEVFVNSFGRPAYGAGAHLLTGVRYPNAGGNDRPLAVTSTDGGLTWIRTDLSGVAGMPADTVLEVCAFGDGIFVAAAQQYGTFTGLKFCTSTDGVTWTAHDAGGFTPTAHVNAIAHNGQSGGAGLFVAVGKVNGVAAIATSPDGVVWTQRGNGQFTRSDAFKNPAFPNFVEHNKQPGADGLWVAHSDLNICTSPDGITWTERQWGTEGWIDAAYGAGTFVAISSQGSSTQKVKTSPDGIVWTVRTAISSAAWNAIAFGAGLFVAVSGAGTVMTSPDGITWTARAAAAANAWNGVCYSATLGLFVAVSSSGAANRVMTSPDGITWTSRVSAANNSWTAVVWSATAGLFVAVASSGAGNRVMTSPDGITWTIRVSAADNTWTSVDYGAGVFVAVGWGASVMTSPDGITWTLHAITNATWKKVRFAEGVFVAGGQAKAASSPDGITWTAPSPMIAVSALVHDGTQFLSIDFNNESWISQDGLTWTYYPGHVNAHYYAGVTHNGLAAPDGLFVIPFVGQTVTAVGAGFIISADGITWTPVDGNVAGAGVGGINICGLAYGDGVWLALINGNDTYDYAVSADAIVWYPAIDQALATYMDNPGVLGFGGNVFVATQYDINIVYRYGAATDADVRWIYASNQIVFDTEHLTTTLSGAGWKYIEAIQPRDEGAYYFEVVMDLLGGANFGFGVGASYASVASPGFDQYNWSFVGSGTPQKINNNTPATYGMTTVAGNVVGVLLDLDVGTISFSINGVDQGIAYSGITAPPHMDGFADGFIPMLFQQTAGSQATARFARADMAFIPDGFKAWDER